MSRELHLAVYLVAVLAGVTVEWIARTRGRLPTLGEVVTIVCRHRSGRWVLIAVWLWTGWHLFVRANWG